MEASGATGGTSERPAWIRISSPSDSEGLKPNKGAECDKRVISSATRHQMRAMISKFPAVPRLILEADKAPSAPPKLNGYLKTFTLSLGFRSKGTEEN